MYIEPCCIDRQLPVQLRQKFGSPMYFQTSGDVTISRFMQALSSMVDAPFVMFLQLPEPDRATLQTIRYYHQRGWLKGLLLLTNADQSSLLTETLGDDLLKATQYACDPLIIDGQLAFLGATHTNANNQQYRDSLIVQGAMLGEKDFSLSLYTASIERSDGQREDSLWQSALAPAISKLRTKPVLTSADAEINAALAWK